MNKKAVYKRVVYFMNEYRKVCVYEKKHDHFLYGHIMGLIDALYVFGTFDFISSCILTDWIIHKTEIYLNEGLSR